MTVRRLADVQPESFEFTKDNLLWSKQEIAKYPPGKGQSAVIALLWRAQKQNDNWLSEPAIRYVAWLLNIAYIRVLEVATFYSMFNLQPVGKYFIQLCGTTPCMLCGSRAIREVCEQRIGASGVVRSDKLFSWTEVECLGACANGPLAQINDNFVEDLTVENFNTLLDNLEAGKPLPLGSLNYRVRSEPLVSRDDSALSITPTLVKPDLYNASRVGQWRQAPHWQQAITDGLASQASYPFSPNVSAADAVSHDAPSPEAKSAATVSEPDSKPLAKTAKKTKASKKKPVTKRKPTTNVT